MRSPRISSLCLGGLAVMVLTTGAWAIPVVPNAPVDTQIIMNVGGGAGGATVFDRSIGALGSLVPIPGAVDTGLIKPVAAYPGPYTFDFHIESALVSETSAGGQAIAQFAAANFTLTDADNGDAVLLAGTIGANFTLKEFPFAYSQTLFGSGIPFSVTGGSLAPWFAPTGKITINLPVTVPNPLADFSADITAGGSITLTTDYVTPEPATGLLLALAGVCLLRRRRAGSN
jgi:hypothetical protein